MAEEGHDPADEVDALAVPIQNPGRDTVRLVPNRRADELRQPVHIDARVVVEQGDEVGPAELNSGVVGGGKSTVPSEGDEADAWMALGNDGERVVGRAVVDHDNLEPIARVRL